VKIIPRENWSFLTEFLFDHLEKDVSLKGYSPEIRKQALSNVLEQVNGKLDEALKADGLNILGSTLKDGEKRLRKRRDENWGKEKDQDLWKRDEKLRRVVGIGSTVYDVLDSYGPNLGIRILTRDERVAYDAIHELTEIYGDARLSVNTRSKRLNQALNPIVSRFKLKHLNDLASVYMYTTGFAGKAASLLDVLRSKGGVLQRNSPPERDDDDQKTRLDYTLETGQMALDVLYRIARGVDKTLEYIPFWTPALYYAAKIAVRAEAERLAYA